MPMQFVIQQSQLKLKVSDCTFQNNYSKPTNYIYNPTQNPSMKKIYAYLLWPAHLVYWN